MLERGFVARQFEKESGDSAFCFMLGFMLLHIPVTLIYNPGFITNLLNGPKKNKPSLCMLHSRLVLDHACNKVLATAGFAYFASLQLQPHFIVINKRPCSPETNFLPSIFIPYIKGRKNTCQFTVFF